ncbi:hypothetical protein FOZ60_011297 [Perkinsus olseni]|uniref:Uncharacterized protein n=1 Tax=Perkinsus olseni TaxID=32597 RepID=A0A7J6PBP6_PEROL|nr:hypothetical protein FOZ60_011297 [Perkinsus olseni]
MAENVIMSWFLSMLPSSHCPCIMAVSDKVAFAANLFYSALLGVGGVVGYMQAGSASSHYQLESFPSVGEGLRKVQLVLVSFLTLFFVKRFQQTSKFMPGGLMAVVGVVVAGVTAAAIKADKNDSPDKKE